MDKTERIAKKIIALKIETLQEFIEFLSSSVKTVHFIFGDDAVTASKNDSVDLDVEFIKLKGKIAEWLAESNHSQPFYPRTFLKKMLKSGVSFDFVERADNAGKMRPADYGLDGVLQMKKFLLARIDQDDEQNGLKFKPNAMGVDRDGMPMDVYNAVTMNYALGQKSKMYLKFSVSKDLSEAFFRMKFISIHEEGMQ